MKQQKIMFSLLLCTLNREKLLKRCVKSLLDQTYRNFELIIVDQSDEANVEYEGNELIHYFHLQDKGLCKSRNFGLKHAKGRFIALIDDDAVYDSNYLLEAIQVLESDKRIGIIAGKGNDPITGEYLLPRMNSKDIVKITWKNIFDYCMSAFMIIDRMILKNGFDINFGVGATYGAGEETDIVIQCLIEKKKVVYVPKMQAYHKANSKNLDFNKVYKYNVGFGALLKKYYMSYNKFLFWGLYLKSLIRSFFGIFLYILGNKEYRRSFYALRGKIEGFRHYEFGD